MSRAGHQATARDPRCDLLFREAHFSDPFGALRAGQVDPRTCWLPVREPDLTPSGRPIPRGPEVAILQEIQAVVVADRAVCVVFAEASRYYQRPGIVYLPAHRDRVALVRAFAAAAASTSGP